MEILIGFLIGLVLGLTGAGGSVFAVPLLVFVLGLSAQQAVGISLVAVGISALFGVLLRLKSNQILWLPAAVYSIIGGLFSPLGVFMNQHIPSFWLMLGFSALVVIVAVRLWQQAHKTPEQTRSVRSSLSASNDNTKALCRINNNQPFALGFRCVSGMALGAILTGILSGLFGVGGGFLIVPTLLFLLGIGIQQAVATSLLIISVVSLSGFASFFFASSSLDVLLLATLIGGGLLGMATGVVSSKKIAGPTLQKLFSVLMILVALMTVYKTVLA